MSNQIFSVNISACSENDFPVITKLISEFYLDDNDLKSAQFLIAKDKGKVVGFGRLRQYPSCSELCSLGVVEDLRLKGIGSAVSRALIKKSTFPLYTVTIIPEFFSRFGFKIVTDFPTEIGVKHSYCTNALTVPETYVVMEFN